VAINSALLHTDVQEFIRSYEGSLSDLAFAGSPFKSVTVLELIQQIEGRNRTKKKLPTWYRTKNILYPPKLNLEQTSSEITAEYKASLIEGKSLADISGGFGVDSFYFAQTVNSVHHFEINTSLSEVVAHNFNQLERTNITCFATDGLQAIRKQAYDVIYADPSRRHDEKGKVYFLSDCVPNIPVNVGLLRKQSKILLLKTAPMLDISVGIKELGAVTAIHIVAIDNEVKELLWVISDMASETPVVNTVNVKKQETEQFSFTLGEPAEATYEAPSRFLYEPNAAIMKSGAFDTVSGAFKIKKLHKHTHLYTSESLREFPGRRFFIKDVVPYSKKEMRKAMKFDKANVATRNFPESVAIIRNKWKLKEGGDRYLFFSIIKNEEKVMLVCEKI